MTQLNRVSHMELNSASCLQELFAAPAKKVVVSCVNSESVEEDRLGQTDQEWVQRCMATLR